VQGTANSTFSSYFSPSPNTETISITPFTVFGLNYGQYLLGGGDPAYQPITYLFYDYTEVNDYSPAAGMPALVDPTLLADSGCLMKTILSTDGNAVNDSYVNISANSNHTPCFVVLNEHNLITDPRTNVANDVSHEWGHVLSSIYARDGILVDNTTYGSQFAAATSLFRDSLSTGITWLNNYYPCAIYIGGDSMDIESGVFSLLADVQGNSFCTTDSGNNMYFFAESGNGDVLSTTPTNYSGATNNLSVLALAEPQFFSNGTPGTAGSVGQIAKETFAETFAFLSGNQFTNGYTLNFPASDFEGFSYLPCSYDIQYQMFATGVVTPGIGGNYYYYASADAASAVYVTCPSS
jgi:hypothetical protein